MSKWLSLLLVFALLLTPYTCSGAEFSPSSEKNASLRLMSTLYTGQNTLVFSPLSLTNALAMAAEGAEGDTKTQLSSLLGSMTDWDFLLDDLAFSGVSMANAAFLHPELMLLPDYEDVLDERYAASVEAMNSGSVMPQVNEWIADATDGMIPEMLSSEPDKDTRLLLIHALSMKSEWESPFPASQTVFTVFHSPDGDIEVSTMRQTGSFAYGKVNGIQAVSLPYRNSVLQMTVFLPEDGNLAPLVDLLSQSPDEFLQQYLPTESARVHLSLPNVRAESSFELKDSLISLGITDAFDPNRADFSAMAENASDLKLHIGSILQKAVLRVNETGTEAAAATQVSMAAGCALIQEETVEMNVDRPFLLLVNDPGSGYILFAACINNPS